MQWFKAWKADAEQLPDDRYVAVCDGIRILAIFMVVWFHIWQQSWLYPVLTLFGRNISFDPLVRSGYMHVDLMILISGFCLYLPYTRLQPGQPLPSFLSFYKKRLVRIAPSYYLTIAIMLVVAIVTDAHHNNYPTLSLDLITHLTFTQMFRMETYYYTHLNAALWTICLEMQLYLVFPIVARLMRRQPILTTLVPVAACTYFRWVLMNAQWDIKPYFNQFPAYFDIFVLGMFTAFLYGKLRTCPHNIFTRIVCSAGTVAALAMIIRLAYAQSSMGNAGYIEQGQVMHRLPLALAGACLLLFAGNAGWLVRHILGNPVMHFLSGISMHIYIWNQVLAVWILQLRIIPSVYEHPNYEGDHPWQLQFTLACFAITFAVAVLLTYFFERPVARRLMRNSRSTGKAVPAVNGTQVMEMPDSSEMVDKLPQSGTAEGADQ
ncbi:MAG: acyltransferase [Clostridia bacterium]|nr:acyltransferase [Clostridia bacterium]